MSTIFDLVSLVKTNLARGSSLQRHVSKPNHFYWLILHVCWWEFISYALNPANHQSASWNIPTYPSFENFIFFRQDAPFLLDCLNLHVHCSNLILVWFNHHIFSRNMITTPKWMVSHAKWPPVLMAHDGTLWYMLVPIAICAMVKDSKRCYGPRSHTGNPYQCTHAYANGLMTIPQYWRSTNVLTTTHMDHFSLYWLGNKNYLSRIYIG